jgi:hypothetical protein
MATLRQLLYCDTDLIRQFLAQLEGGIFDEEHQAERTGGRTGVGGEVKAGPLGGRADRGREESQEVERVVCQTEASEFDRLYRSLSQQGNIQFLENIDDAIWDQLQRREIVEVEAVIRPAGLEKISELFIKFQEILPLIDAMGAEGSIQRRVIWWSPSLRLKQPDHLKRSQ